MSYQTLKTQLKTGAQCAGWVCHAMVTYGQVCASGGHRGGVLIYKRLGHFALRFSGCSGGRAYFCPDWVSSPASTSRRSTVASSARVTGLSG